MKYIIDSNVIQFIERLSIDNSSIFTISNDKAQMYFLIDRRIIKRFCRIWNIDGSKINIYNFRLKHSWINVEIQRYFKIYSNGFTLGNIRFPFVCIYSAKSVIRENISFHVTLISVSDWNSFRFQTKFFCVFEIYHWIVFWFWNKKKNESLPEWIRF